MITISGESVWPKGSEHGDTVAPSLPAIGAGLGRTARFAGQTKAFYTVLLHTFTVANLVAPEHRVYALLHDAPEAIVGDVPTTWKSDSARAHEDDLLERITRMVGLPWPWPDGVHEAVKEADLRALAAEAHVLGHAEAAKWWPHPDQEAMVDTALQTSDVIRYLDPHEAGFRYVTEVADALRMARPEVTT